MDNTIHSKLLGKTFMIDNYNYTHPTGNNGVCVDHIEFKTWGFDHERLYIKDKTNCELYNNEVIHIPSRITPKTSELVGADSKLRLDYNYDQDVVSFKSDSPALMKQLEHIESLGIVSDGQRKYFLNFLIYEQKNMGVKIPYKVIMNTGEEIWEYEYLIYPNFRKNESVIEKLKVLTGDDTIDLNLSPPQDIEHKPAVRFFSTGLYNILLEEIHRANAKARASINAVRAEEHHIIAPSDFFEVFQNSRIASKDNIDSVGYVPTGTHPFVKNYTFKQYIDLFGLKLVDLSNIALDDKKLLEFRNEVKGNPAFEPMIIYMDTLRCSPFDAMDKYVMIERERNYLKKLMYQLNMVLYDSFELFYEDIRLYRTMFTGVLEKPYNLVARVEWVTPDGFTQGIVKKGGLSKPRIQPNKSSIKGFK